MRQTKRFCPKSETTQWCPPFLMLLDIMLASLVKAIRQDKKIKEIQVGIDSENVLKTICERNGNILTNSAGKIGC